MQKIDCANIIAIDIVNVKPKFRLTFNFDCYIIQMKKTKGHRMKYYTNIIPIVEARLYLSQRFIIERTSFRIADCVSKNKCTKKKDLAFLDKVISLERTLDETFPEDELMRYYFSPLKTKDMRANEPLTIGGMLLSIPYDLKPPFNFDSLINYLKSKPKDEILRHFYQSALDSFVSESQDEIKELSDFVAHVDDVLISPVEKWNLIDAVCNPVLHIERLRELVCAVADLIEAQSNTFKPLIEACRESFLATGLHENLRMLNFDVKTDENTEANIYPSLFMFNGMEISITNNTRIRIFIGFFIEKILKSRRINAEVDEQISLLKSLSDGTRFRVLYSLRNRYSFGQELSEEFGGTRNAMYYHLEKLVGIGLIDCKVTDYRMLYTMNKHNVYDRLTALRDFLVGGWTPEDDEGQEDEPEEEKVQR